MNVKNLNLEKAAAEFRSHYGYDMYNPIRIKSLLLQLKVLIVYWNMEPSFSGMSLKIDDNKFMLVNSVHPIGRQHFTICHELYHLYIQDLFEFIICDDNLIDNEKTEEDNADLFAANLILPREGVLKLIPDNELNKRDLIQISTILEIEQFFSSSHSALLRRLKSLNIITENYMQELLPNIQTKAKQFGFDTSLYNSGNDKLILGDYGTKAKKLFDKNIISESHYIELMRAIGIDLEESEINIDETEYR